MDRVMNYIFGSLQRADENFLQIAKAFKAQNKMNKLMTISLFMTTYASYSAYKSHQASIKKLEKEIAELKAKQQLNESCE